MQLEASISTAVELDLACFALPASWHDRALSSAIARNKMGEFTSLFLHHHKSFTYRQLPDLLFMQERTKRFDSNPAVLFGIALEKGIERVREKQAAEDADIRLLERLYQAKDPCETLLASAPESPLKAFALTLWKHHDEKSERTNFVRALRIAELVRQETFSAHQSPLILDLECQGIDWQALKKRSQSPLCIQSVGQFLLQCEGCTEAILWKEYLRGHSRPVELKTHERKIIRQALAILRDDLVYLLSLLFTNCAIDEQDEQGYTSAHFAAMLGHWKALMILHKLKASFSLRTKHGLNVYDILKLRGFTQRLEPTASTYSASALFHLWLKKVKNDHPADLHSLERAVVESWYARAKVEHTAGAFLFERTGQIVTRDELVATKERQWKVSPELSLLASSNEPVVHGFPNCKMLSLVLDGRVRLLLYALKPLKQGEPLMMDLGDDQEPVVNTQELELFLKETKQLTSFLEKEKKSSAFCEIVVTKNGIQRRHLDLPKGQERAFLCKLEQQQQMIGFLYRHPEQLYKLVEKKALTAARVFSLFEVVRELGLPNLYEEADFLAKTIHLLQIASKG